MYKPRNSVDKQELEQEVDEHQRLADEAQQMANKTQQLDHQLQRRGGGCVMVPPSLFDEMAKNEKNKVDNLNKEIGTLSSTYKKYTYKK